MKRTASRSRGQSLVEVALMLPLFLILILGTIEVAHAFHSFNILVSTSREAGRLGSRGETFFDPLELTSVVDDNTSSLDFFEDSRGRLVIIRVTINDSGGIDTYECQVVTTPGSVADCSAGDTDLPQSTLQSLLQAAGTPAAEDSFVVVELFYDHPLLVLDSVIDNPLPMHTYAIMPESGR
jgi:Flp pilus assembly protein TadG